MAIEKTDEVLNGNQTLSNDLKFLAEQAIAEYQKDPNNMFLYNLIGNILNLSSKAAGINTIAAEILPSVSQTANVQVANDNYSKRYHENFALNDELQKIRVSVTKEMTENPQELDSTFLR